MKYGLRLNSEMKYWDLKKQLSELCILDPELMLICELSNSQIRCILPNDQKIKPNTAVELYVYELPKLDNVLVRSRAGSELAINIEKGLKDIQRTPGNNTVDQLYLLFIRFSIENPLSQSYCYCVTLRLHSELIQCFIFPSYIVLSIPHLLQSCRHCLSEIHHHPQKQNSFFNTVTI